MCSLATRFTRSGVLLAVLVAGQPAAAQPCRRATRLCHQRRAIRASSSMCTWSRASIGWPSGTRAWTHSRLTPRRTTCRSAMTLRMASWRGEARYVRLTPRILVGGELGKVQDQDRFVVTELPDVMVAGGCSIDCVVRATDVLRGLCRTSVRPAHTVRARVSIRLGSDSGRRVERSDALRTLPEPAGGPPPRTTSSNKSRSAGLPSLAPRRGARKPY
jgi:hypothetical protein